MQDLIQSLLNLQILSPFWREWRRGGSHVIDKEVVERPEAHHKAKETNQSRLLHAANVKVRIATTELETGAPTRGAVLVPVVAALFARRVSSSDSTVCYVFLGLGRKSD